LTTKIHLLVNELGLPLDRRLTAGQVSDYAIAIELLGESQAEAVIVDNGLDSDKIVEHVEKTIKAEVVISPRSNRKQQRDRMLHRKTEAFPPLRYAIRDVQNDRSVYGCLGWLLDRSQTNCRYGLVECIGLLRQLKTGVIGIAK
jgi:transposase